MIFLVRFVFWSISINSSSNTRCPSGLGGCPLRVSSWTDLRRRKRAILLPILWPAEYTFHCYKLRWLPLGHGRDLSVLSSSLSCPFWRERWMWSEFLKGFEKFSWRENGKNEKLVLVSSLTIIRGPFFRSWFNLLLPPARVQMCRFLQRSCSSGLRAKFGVKPVTFVVKTNRVSCPWWRHIMHQDLKNTSVN